MAGKSTYVDPANRLVAVPIQAAANARTVDVGVLTPLFSNRLAVGANIFTTGINSKAQYAVAATADRRSPSFKTGRRRSRSDHPCVNTISCGGDHRDVSKRHRMRLVVALTRILTN
jgi:hypothetical protein